MCEPARGRHVVFGGVTDSQVVGFGRHANHFAG
jgi:hypothetical protein